MLSQHCSQISPFGRCSAHPDYSALSANGLDQCWRVLVAARFCHPGQRQFLYWHQNKKQNNNRIFSPSPDHLTDSSLTKINQFMFQCIFEILQQHKHFTNHSVRPSSFHSQSKVIVCSRFVSIAVQCIFILLILLVPIAQIVTCDGQMQFVLVGKRSLLLS